MEKKVRKCKKLKAVALCAAVMGAAAAGVVPVEVAFAAASNLTDGVPGAVDTTWQMSPDEQWVVFRAWTDNDHNSLWAARTNGSGDPVLLSGVLPGYAKVEEFEISPDSGKVVFRVDRVADGAFGLYARNIDGSGLNVSLSAAAAGKSVYETWDGIPAISFAPGNPMRVIYRQDLQAGAGETLNLRSVRIDGSDLRTLNNALDANRDVSNFTVSDDGTQVLYSANAEADDTVQHVYRVPANGLSAPVRISKLKSDGNGGLDSQGLTLDIVGNRAVYTRDRSPGGSVSRWQLWSRPVNGIGWDVELTGNSDPFTDIDLVVPVPSVDGVPGILYRIGQGLNSHLYLAPADGSAAPVQLIPSGGAFDVQFNDDHTQVVWLTGNGDVWTSPTNVAAATQLGAGNLIGVIGGTNEQATFWTGGQQNQLHIASTAGGNPFVPQVPQGMFFNPDNGGLAMSAIRSDGDAVVFGLSNWPDFQAAQVWVYGPSGTLRLDQGGANAKVWNVDIADYGIGVSNALYLAYDGNTTDLWTVPIIV